MFDVIKLRIRTLLRKETIEEDLDDELRYHLEKAVQQNIARGMTPDEARRTALIGLGGLEQRKEECREARGLRFFDDLSRDLRYGARMLARNRGLTLVIVLILGIGIGANTAIFSMLDALLVKVLPVKDPEQLVILQRSSANGEIETDDFPYPVFERLRNESRSFSGVLALDNSRVSVTIDGRPELIWGDFVSGSYFEVLGVGAALGRTFNDGDDRPGANPVAVISYSFWDRRLSRDASVIGRTIYLGKIPFTVIGVAPKGFFGLNEVLSAADVILPMFVHSRLALADHDTFQIVARLRPEVSRESAVSESDVIFKQFLTETIDPSIKRETQGKLARINLSLKPGLRGFTGDAEDLAKEMRILFAVVAIVLLIVSVNIANLLLARAASRQKEMSVRLAIGADGGRLIRQSMTESAMLGVLGGALGLFVAKWGAVALVAVLSSLSGEAIRLSLDLSLKVLGFAAGVSLGTGLLFGIAPALTATRVDLTRVLNEGGRESRPLRKRLTKSLVISQIALSMALLVGAGLLVRTLRELSSVNPGFPSDRVLSMWCYPALIGYDHDKEMRLYREVLEKLNSTQGIQSASLTRLSLDNRSGPVGPGFFKTTGIELLEGREFTDADTDSSMKVAVINESTARRLFPNEDPIGRPLPKGQLDFDELQTEGDATIVGVAKDVRHRLRSQPRDREVYIPYTQAPARMLGQAQFLVRSDLTPAAVIPLIRQQVQSVEKDLPLLRIRTVAEEMNSSFVEERSLASLLGLFSVLALGLASVGLYGTLSYTVGKKTKELGIRMALGAERRNVLWMVMVETLRMVVTGVAVGIPIALLASRLISNLLFGVRPADPAAISVAVVVMLVTSLIAAYLPARRASKVDPATALRCE